MRREFSEAHVENVEVDGSFPLSHIIMWETFHLRWAFLGVVLLGSVLFLWQYMRVNSGRPSRAVDGAPGQLADADASEPAPTELGAYVAWAKSVALRELGTSGAETLAEPLVIVMGNDAGDLDSVASAIALSYLLNHEQAYFTEHFHLPRARYVPLIQTEHAALRQRRENLIVYDMVSIDTKHLLCIDDVRKQVKNLTSSPALNASRGVSLALVDHAALAAEWGHALPRRVELVLDHHEDEQVHQDAAMRIIRPPSTSPVGSTSTLVAQLYERALGGRAPNREVADLLLSAGLIDTNNYKPAPSGKAQADDDSARTFLQKHSSFADAGGAQATLLRAHKFLGSTGASAGTADTAEWARLLRTVKADVSHLDALELLQRDSKVAVVNVWRIGIASVPLSLSAWLSDAYRRKDKSEYGSVSERDAQREWDAWWRSLYAWIAQERLDAAAVLLSFKDEQGKKRREIVLGFRSRQDQDKAAFLKLVKGLETHGTNPGDSAPSLELSSWHGMRRQEEIGKHEHVEGLENGNVGHVRAQPIYGAVFRQGNAKANRKVVHPAIVQLLSSRE